MLVFELHASRKEIGKYFNCGLFVTLSSSMKAETCATERVGTCQVPFLANRAKRALAFSSL